MSAGKHDPRVKEQALALYRAGLSANQVARFVQCCAKSVNNYARAAGIARSRRAALALRFTDRAVFERARKARAAGVRLYHARQKAAGIRHPGCIVGSFVDAAGTRHYVRAVQLAAGGNHAGAVKHESRNQGMRNIRQGSPRVEA